jgi:hypothetical protein
MGRSRQIKGSCDVGLYYAIVEEVKFTAGVGLPPCFVIHRKKVRLQAVGYSGEKQWEAVDNQYNRPFGLALSRFLLIEIQRINCIT